MHAVVLLLQRVGAIVGNGCEVQGQNYAAMYQGSEKRAGFTVKILCIPMIFSIKLGTGTSWTLIDSKPKYQFSDDESFPKRRKHRFTLRF